MTDLQALRTQLDSLLDSNDAHAGFEAAVKDIPPELRGVQPSGSPHSLWQLLEHIRIGQHDILDFCINPAYAEKKWPDDYWPASPEPPSTGAWDESVAAFRRDRDAMKQLVTHSKVDLFAKIPHGTGQTYLREVLLVADHNAYHIGQLVAARRQLGIWPA